MTMFNVAIIDDELFVRKNLILKLARTEFSAVFDTDDGEALLSYLENNHIDLVFVDLSMPLMNGLDLIRKVKEKHDTLFCILTGYSDFEYMKEAIRLSVTDYLLKPLEDEKFEKAILAISEKLEKKKRAEKNEILYQLLSGDTTKEYNYEQIIDSGNMLRLTLLGNWNGNQKWEDFRESNGFVCSRMPNLMLEISEKLSGSKQVFETQTEYIVKIDNAKELGAIVEKGKQIIKKSIVLSTYTLCDENYVSQTDKFDKILADIEKFARRNELGEIISHVEMALRRPNISQMEYEDFLTRLGLILYKNAKGVQQLLDIAFIWSVDTKEELQNEIIAQLKYMLYPADTNENISSCYECVEKLINAIKNDCSKNYSLNAVAEQYFFHRSHLSRIFKQITGKSFNQYLTDVRIERACRLISDEYRISSVASAVGFDDAHYFSLVFKKKTGFGPLEWKKAHGPKNIT